MPSSVALRLDGISVRFGGVLAVDTVDLDVPIASAVGLIGPNGAGKTTVLNVISGFVNNSAGRVVLEGQDISRLSAKRRALSGLGRTFQTPRLFPGLTVSQNLDVVCRRRSKNRRGLSINEALDITNVGHLRDHDAKHLHAGERRFVEIARALMLAPSVLLLDEPATGLRGSEVGDLSTLIKLLTAEHQIAVLVISHDMRIIYGCCTEVVVLVEGRVLRTGRPEEIRQDRTVVAAYFGGELT